MRSVTKQNSDSIRFESATGEFFVMMHDQDCCESVYIDDVVGDLQDLVGAPILMADESTNHDNPKYPEEDSFTWTFFRFATVKGYATVRWYGSSNGYYGESASLFKVQ